MLERLLFLGIIIGSNNLAAALTLGALGQAKRVWRVVTVFGGFEFLIPLVGIWLGQQISLTLGDQTSWIAPVLLTGIALLALYSAIQGSPEDKKITDKVTSWGGLIFLAVGLSVDNLVIGFSLGLTGMEPLLVATTIALFSLVFTWLGMHLGAKARRHWQQYTELGAGILLLGLAMASWANLI